LVRGKGRAWELPKPVQFYGFPSEAQVYFQNTAFLSDLELAFQQHLERLSYLGPLRSPPERLYSWSGVVPQDVGWQGESAIQAILASGQRALNFKHGARLRPFRAVVGRWLEDLGLLSSFNLTEVAPDRDLYEVRVRAQSRSEEVALSDVGFGVSQVLPVVTQVFYAPPGSTVLIEQPELHLHPAAQSALGDLFIDAIQAREDAAPRGVQLIVESHSEHVLRRIQRRVAERRLSDSDVAVYVCNQSPSGSRIDRLQLDLFGDIRNWPPDFFGDELEDVVLQASLSAKGRLQAGKDN
jgi:predicted ATPase